MERKIYILTGPTAVGKTEHALRFAEEVDAEIISCDASLFYLGMDIGTAKPTAEEQARVPHHMIDVCPVAEAFDIVAYVAAVTSLVEEIFKRRKAVLVTGGSGFYLKSFLAPVTDSIVVSDELREEVEVLYETEGLNGLVEQLADFNPEGFGRLDLKNPRRVLRALERCQASGYSLNELAERFALQPEPFGDCKKHLILLERNRETLHRRVEKRAKAMLNDGLVEEVETLLRKGIQKNQSAASAIGYRETIAFLQGELSEELLLPEIVKNTKRLVKKQSTWFRTQLRPPDETWALEDDA